MGAHVDVDAQRATPDDSDHLPEQLLPGADTRRTRAVLCPPRLSRAGREDRLSERPLGDKFLTSLRAARWRSGSDPEEKSGRTLCVNVLNDGDFFGEITLITGFPRTATVRTIAVTTCISSLSADSSPS